MMIIKKESMDEAGDVKSEGLMRALKGLKAAAAKHALSPLLSLRIEVEGPAGEQETEETGEETECDGASDMHSSGLDEAPSLDDLMDQKFRK